MNNASFPNAVTGDLLLIRTRKNGKSANLSLQTILRFRIAKFSHVAIVLGPGTALHSIPHGGVQSILLSELLFSSDVVCFTVLRNSMVAKSAKKTSELRTCLMYYLDQPYNKVFFARIRDHSSYCSELAAKAYSKIGFPLSHRNAKFVLPIDLEKLVFKEKWLDVTHEYHYSLGDLLDFDPIFNRAIQAAKEFDNIMMDADLGLLELQRLHREISLELNEGNKCYVPDYWDSHLPIKKKQGYKKT